MASATDLPAAGCTPRAGQDPAQALAGHCFEVGGCVRDALLGRPFRDRDWVVVGLSPERMLEAGFKPVGRDFPVFLHPVSGEEYALARTERKSAPGYHGFVFHADPEVTLEQDLARRDLSINAMARAADGTLIDPFDGQHDLRERVLRHVSPAFAEDPVRLLRVARFAARFGDFAIAPATMALMRDLVQAGEVDALVPERVWQEISRGLMEPHPQRMLLTLRECGALQRLLPEVDRLWGVPQPAEHHPEVDTGAHLMLVLEQCARVRAPLPVRWAAIAHDLGKGTTPRSQWPRHLGHEERSARLAAAVANRLKVPSDCRELADVVAREHGHIHASASFGAEATLRLLKRCDALRRPERFALALLACECDARGRAGRQDEAYGQAERLMGALQAARGVDASALAEQAAAAGLEGSALGQRIDRARCEAIAALFEGAQAPSALQERP